MRSYAGVLVGFSMVAMLVTPWADAQQQQRRPAATRPATQPAGRGFGALPANPKPGDHLIHDYFKTRVAEIEAKNLTDIKTVEDWTAKKAEYRRELAEMLGLDPMPAKTDLKPVVTGRIDHPEFVVEKLHFQSMPGLYVTGNLYLPLKRDGKAPTILYVCGHSVQKDPKTGVSYGNKAGYHHHGAWFARNGYVCLTIDTLQLGEIEGLHHGLHREKMWWLINRGYTPAGVEAWNCIRALDYLETRPEVDATKFGVTGRSGGGAYSWWIAALDDRIQCAVPVAGITDQQNHICDGVIEGHCDCMFMVNTHRWDFSKVAALVSPRPLLIANTDKDQIFPLDGVERVHWQTKRIYALQKATDKLGLLVTEGPHKDTQDLQVPALRWFNRWLKNDTEPLSNYAAKTFEPAQLKVFDTLPADAGNKTIQERFVAKAPAPQTPADEGEWIRQRDGWLAGLRAQTFAAWPADAPPVEPKPLFSATKNGVRLSGYEFASQPHVPVRFYVASGSHFEGPPELVVLNVVDEADWDETMSAFKADFGKELADLNLPDPKHADEAASTLRMLKGTKWAMAYVAVRGVGPTAWSGDEKRLTHLRRRFWLIGESLDGMRVWDTIRAVQAAKTIELVKSSPIWLQGEGRMAGVALYASLFEPGITRLDLHRLPVTHDLNVDGPDLLNVLKVLDVPAAVAIAAERSKVRIYAEKEDAAGPWRYPIDVAKKLGWPADRIQVR